MIIGMVEVMLYIMCSSIFLYDTMLSMLYHILPDYVYRMVTYGNSIGYQYIPIQSIAN